MSLEQWSYLAQIVGSVGVIVSLLFVGWQIRLNTLALERNEHNSTMTQWTVIRQAIATDRDMAELMTAGLSGERRLDGTDQLRLGQMFRKCAWASFHVWDRMQPGVLFKGTFQATAGVYLCELLRTPGRRAWWGNAKHGGFVPQLLADVDALLAGAGAP